MLASRHESGHLHAVRPTRGASTGGGRATHPAPEPDPHPDLRDGRDGERLRHPWSEGAPPVSDPVAVGVGREGAAPAHHRGWCSPETSSPWAGTSRHSRKAIRYSASAAGCSAPMRRRSAGRPTASWRPWLTNLSYEEAAALPYGGLLAMHCLRKARLQPGQRVLIYGASGAIGTAAVERPGTSGPA